MDTEIRISTHPGTQPQSASVIEAQLASEAAKEMLSAGHEYTESFQDTFTLGERSLNNTPGVLNLRDIAIKIFQALLNNQRYRRIALDIANDIGSSRMQEINERDIPLAARIALDRQTVLKEISALDLNQLGCIELSETEDLLLKWWLMDKPGSKDAVNILRRLKRSTQYRLIRRYISSDFVIDDFDQLLQQAPAEDRWAWWWHSYGRLISRRDSTGIQGLARELSEEYKSADQIKQFLIDVDSLIAPLNPWPNPPILQFWVDQNPEPFLALVQPNQWSSIPPRFQGQISTAIVKYDQNYVEMKCRDILEKLPDIPGNELHDFMTMVTVNRIPHELLRETFLEIAKRSNSPNRGYFIYQLYFYFEPTKDGSSYLRLICKATHDELTTAYCNHLAFFPCMS